jgi:hypothetical protein
VVTCVDILIFIFLFFLILKSLHILKRAKIFTFFPMFVIMFQFLLVEMIEEQENGAIIYGFILQPPKRGCQIYGRPRVGFRAVDSLLLVFFLFYFRVVPHSHWC